MVIMRRGGAATYRPTKFDLGGALINNNTAVLEMGGEQVLQLSYVPLDLPSHAVNSFIAELRAAEGQLNRRFILMSNYICFPFPSIDRIDAYGYAYAPRMRKDRTLGQLSTLSGWIVSRHNSGLLWEGVCLI